MTPTTCSSSRPVLARDFYIQEDVVLLAKQFLGKFLCTKDANGIFTSAMIVETEAYKGPSDKASHAYNNRRTPRTEVLFQEGGIAYVYLCYGIHHLFNIVTAPKNIPHAVLIRGVLPEEGQDIMKKRRLKTSLGKGFSDGPATTCQAMGISIKDNQKSLLGTDLWIEDRGKSFHGKDIHAAPRIGIDYAQEDVQLPWRFFVNNQARQKKNRGSQ